LPQAVLGLGNPGEDYRETRHNVGQRVVDVLARSLHQPFRREDAAMVAHARWRGEPVLLIKPLSFMNATGPVVAGLAQRLDFGPGDCILVYDDIDLPLGTVRARMKGSAGGHNGVRSVLDALQTETVRRVRIGVGRPTDRSGVRDHVLGGFMDEERPLVDQACAAAAEKVLELVARP
jgi:PTH1 family peptidyl-tRNA hydrolase